MFQEVYSYQVSLQRGGVPQGSRPGSGPDRWVEGGRTHSNRGTRTRSVSGNSSHTTPTSESCSLPGCYPGSRPGPSEATPDRSPWADQTQGPRRARDVVGCRGEARRSGRGINPEQRRVCCKAPEFSFRTPRLPPSTVTTEVSERSIRGRGPNRSGREVDTSFGQGVLVWSVPPTPPTPPKRRPSPPSSPTGTLTEGNGRVRRSEGDQK